MPKSGAHRGDRVFSIELNAGNDLRKVSVPSDKHRILLEGTIGSLRGAGFVEDTILQLEGSRGVLRVDLSLEDLAKPASDHRRSED
jgi:hypothetical protein